jgi:isopentenyl phosphate kinase
VVQRDVRALDGIVVDALLKAGLAPVVLPPSAILGLDDGRVSSFDVAPFRDYLRQGFTPVTFGDVVRDRTRGVAVCSGDVLMLELAKAFRPRCVVFAADVDGLFTADPKRSREARLLLAVSEADLSLIDFGPATGADVTGGIEAKVRRMLEIASFADETIIVNGNVKNRVRDALRGRIVIGTRVVGGR